MGKPVWALQAIRERDRKSLLSSQSADSPNSARNLEDGEFDLPIRIVETVRTPAIPIQKNGLALASPCNPKMSVAAESDRERPMFASPRREDKNRKAERSCGELSGNNRRGQSLHILIAEDNSVNQTFLRRALERLDHVPVTAVNGRDAVERFKTHTFDMIFMDVQMPDMDGFSATAAIREQEKLTGRHVPICAMTAHALKGDRERCLAAGMDSYLSKPATLADIERTVLQVMEGKQSNAVTLKEPWRSEPWDRAAALDRVNGDEPLLSELIDIFFQEYPRLAACLIKGLECRDLPSLREPAHTLKGSLKYLEAPAAANLAQQIEETSASLDIRSATELLNRFMAEVELARQAMQASRSEEIHEPAHG